MTGIKIKYVICPGNIRSKIDGDLHYISFTDLIRLYKVNPSQCIQLPEGSDSYSWTPPEGAVFLKPRYDGDYSIPKGRYS